VDSRLEALGNGSPNFGFLGRHQRLLAIYGALAEANVFTNPNGSIVHTGQFGEVLAQELIVRTGLPMAGDRQIDRLNTLTAHGVLLPGIQQAFHALRTTRNDATHSHLFDRSRALATVRTCFELGDWFDQAITGVRVVRAFVPPAEPQVTDPRELAELRQALDVHRQTLAEAMLRIDANVGRLEAERAARAEAEAAVEQATAHAEGMSAQIAALEVQITALRVAQDARFNERRRSPQLEDKRNRDVIIRRGRMPRPLSEAAARRRIDEMLTQAGWVVQDHDRLNPRAGVGVAVREFRLATGYADYVLYVNARIVGVVEAKREGQTLSAAQAQATRYDAGVLPEYALAVWRSAQPLAFRYASTATETSFVNQLDPQPRTRIVFSFHRPETIAAWMHDVDASPAAPTFRAKVRQLPALAPDGLRDAQVTAIGGIEQSLARNDPRVLVQMATGAGKTFAAITESYRLIRHAGARRILFLADRNNLVRQARREFRNYPTPDDGRKLSELYSVDRLTNAGVQSSSTVVVATIQLVYAMLRGQPVPDDNLADAADAQDEEASDAEQQVVLQAPAEVAYSANLPPEAFDLIIVDECHRSIYGLWRGVLDYFDAPIIGLTATPTAATMGFFNANLVSQYPYEQSVVDGVNVDFDIVRLQTRTTADGATVDAGNVLLRRNRQTREQRYWELEDDYTYTGGQLGDDVIGEDQIRTVLTAFKDSLPQLFPGRASVPKTLIFARNDNHAEEILKHVKLVFAAGDGFTAKITYAVRKAGGNTDQLTNDLRTSPRLRIAITVDMLSTGIDIRALECVLFLRQVKSPILFEQMRGRGCRTVDNTELQQVTPGATTDLAKDRFIVYDAVGVTDSPLVERNQLLGDEQKRVILKDLLAKTATGAISEPEVRALAGRLARLDRRLSPDDRADIAELSGGLTVTQIAQRLAAAVDIDRQLAAEADQGPDGPRQLILDAITPLMTNPDLRDRLATVNTKTYTVSDTVTEDTLLEMRTIPRAERAQARVSDWHDYLEQRRNEVVVQRIVRGSKENRVSYAELKELAAKIKQPRQSWTPEIIWRAYQDLGKATAHSAGIPDLITLIRYELGIDGELRPYQDLVADRFINWMARQQEAGVAFTDDQVWWLEAIRDTIAASAGISVDDLRHEPFMQHGGPVAYARTFGQETAMRLLTELDQELAA